MRDLGNTLHCRAKQEHSVLHANYFSCQLYCTYENSEEQVAVLHCSMQPCNPFMAKSDVRHIHAKLRILVLPECVLNPPYPM